MKNLLLLIVASTIIFSSTYKGSTTSAVVLAGGIIKSTHIDPSNKKYERKNCPVCKGTGRYLSGDGIKMVDCGYCEPDKKGDDSFPQTNTISPQTIAKPKCYGPNCRYQNK